MSRRLSSWILRTTCGAAAPANRAVPASCTSRDFFAHHPRFAVLRDNVFNIGENFEGSYPTRPIMTPGMRSTRLRSKRLVLAFLTACSLMPAGGNGSHAEYVGGTVLQIPSGCQGSVQAVDTQYFVFYSKNARWRVPYEKINLLEYGQKVDRRYIAAVLVSPLFLLSKKRQHFLTVGYQDEDNQQQAMVFKVDKDDIRTILVSLEARTGRKVEFQDDDARRGGKG